MTIPRLTEMTAYWKYNPPIHVMIASYLGVQSKTKAVNDVGSFDDLLAGVPKTW